jgi:tetratricopeptide (TPR) repeat protein
MRAALTKAPTLSDKYKELLSRHDWNKPTPPPGYQYGIGRGAKAFVTSLETASETALQRSLLKKVDTEMLTIFDGVEEAVRNARRNNKKRDRDDDDDDGKHKTTTVTKLTADDLLTIGSGLNSAPAAGSLMVKAARSAESDLAADEILFGNAKDIVLPTKDFTPMATTTATAAAAGAGSSTTGAVVVSQSELSKLLTAGSESEPSTWVTRSRAHMAMGFPKRAWKALEDGCRIAGSKGAVVWLERLKHLSERPSEYRAVAEEAVKAFPSSEELWNAVLSVQPLHRQLEFLQRGVIAVPTSESLWSRLVDATPSNSDKRKILQRALATTPSLTKLWARFAYLEPRVEQAMRIFTSVREKHPSLSIAVEQCAYDERHSVKQDHATESTASTTTTANVVLRGAWRDVLLRQVSVFLQTRGLVKKHQAQTSSIVIKEDAPAWTWSEWGEAVQHCLLQSPLTAAALLLVAVLPSGLNGSESGFEILQSLPSAWADDVRRLGEQHVCNGEAAATSPLSVLTMTTTNAATTNSGEGTTTDTTKRRSVSFAVAVFLAASMVHQTLRLPSSSSSSSPHSETAPRGFAGSVPSSQDSVFQMATFALLTVPASTLTLVLRDGEGQQSAMSQHSSAAAAAAKTGVAVAEEEEEEEELLVAMQQQQQQPDEGNRTTDSSADQLPPYEWVNSVLRILLRHVVPAMFRQPQDPSHSSGSTALVTGALQMAKALFRRSLFELSRSLLHCTVMDAGSQTCRATCLSWILDADQDRVNIALAKLACAMGQSEEATRLLVQRISAGAKDIPVDLHSQQAEAPSTTTEGDNTNKENRLPTAERSGAPEGEPSATDVLDLFASTGDKEEKLAAKASSIVPSFRGGGSELLWIKYCVHLRSLGQLRTAHLEVAVQQHPTSKKLWLIRLSFVRQLAMERKSMSLNDAAAVSNAALQPGAARNHTEVWAYVALRMEAELFGRPQRGRSLLSEAVTHFQRSTSGAASRHNHNNEVSIAILVLARARLEFAHTADPTVALDIARQHLEKNPSIRVHPVGAMLMALFLQASPPALRGPHASVVLKQWNGAVVPLVVIEVALIYHAAKHYDKAYQQAKKAVSLQPRCGDALGLLLALSRHTAYAELLGSKELQDGGEPSSSSGVEATSPEDVEARNAAAMTLVMKETRRAAYASIGWTGGEPQAHNNLSEKDDDGSRGVQWWPNEGPRWIAVSKDKDPRNVTLAGYRESLETMLLEVASQFSLE